MIYILIIIIVILDQASKLLIRNNLNLGESVPIINNIFHLTYVQNTGAAFGILRGYTSFFIITTIIIIAGLFIYRYYSPANLYFDIAIGLIIAGAIGNLLDRIFNGAVVDFLDFRIWPVFNVADSAIVIGVIILSIYLYKSELI